MSSLLISRLCSIYLCLCIFSIAHTQSSPPHKLDDRNVSEILKELDNEILRKNIYKDMRVARIDSLSKLLPSAVGKREYLLYSELFALYAHFNADSALHYNAHLASTDYVAQHPELHNELLINLAEALGVMGMYNDALAKLDEVKTDELDRDTRTRYYQIRRSNYGWLTDFTTESSLKRKYRHLTDLYRDSILTIQPHGAGYDIVLADRANTQGRPDEALAIMERIKDKVDNKQLSYVYYTMSEAYRIKGDTEGEEKYLALTGISDLRGGVKEYVALSRLAMLMFEQGNVDRAYSYLFCAMEDAAESRAGLRSIESSRVFPIIDRAYKKQERYTRRLFIAASVLFALFAIALTLGFISLRKQAKKIAAARRQLATANKLLEDANAKLQDTNENLSKTGKIKEMYITRYLHRCRSYLDEMSEYRRGLLKLARSSRIDELNKMLKSDAYIKEENQKFYRDFDESFVRLFPDFVDKINTLLLPEERIELRNEEMLTTELRIYALIRLGVDDSKQIAHFLGNSLTTVYNYRSKIRGKAIDKANFEQRVMEID